MACRSPYSSGTLSYKASDVGSEIRQRSRSFITRIIGRCCRQFNDKRSGTNDCLLQFVLDLGKSNKFMMIRIRDGLRGNFEQTKSDGLEHNLSTMLDVLR